MERLQPVAKHPFCRRDTAPLDSFTTRYAELPGLPIGTTSLLVSITRWHWLISCRSSLAVTGIIMTLIVNADCGARLDCHFSCPSINSNQIMARYGIFVSAKIVVGLLCRPTMNGCSGYSHQVCNDYIFSLSVLVNYLSGWTRGFVSPLFKWNDQLPTVLQALTYWIASAMDLPGAWVMPEVGVEPEYSRSEIPCAVYDIMDQNLAAAIALSCL